MQDVPRVTRPIALRSHRTLDDYRFVRALTNRPIKMTLPGPFTLVDGTFDEYYGDERTLALAFADALRDEIIALAGAGCDIVQLDEPAVTRLPEKLHAWGAEAIDRAFGDAAVTAACTSATATRRVRPLARRGFTGMTRYCRRSPRHG